AQASSVAAQRDANRAERTSVEVATGIERQPGNGTPKAVAPMPPREPSPWDELMESEAAEAGPGAEFWAPAEKVNDDMIAGEDEDAPLVSKLWSRIRSKNGTE
ncbi:MAG: hypothetical protein M3134_03335, partial [Actinomycetota bacterium]|nr:hypothetical protein [Actinomycetota bacterium]